MKIRKDIDGSAGPKFLILLVAVGAIVALLLSGVISISLPTGTDKYSEIVNRHATDCGIKVPIEIKLSWTQEASTGSNRADLDANVKHKHEALGSDDNYVPDATLISSTNFNTEVGNVDDTSTIFCINGNSFQASNITYNTTLTSLAGVQYGNAQVNYKVWTKSTTYTPPVTPGTTSKDNSGIIIQTVWKHYRKGTNELLNSDTVTWMIYYQMPSYNADADNILTFTYYVFVPFDDYALIEDLKVDIFGFTEHCNIQWTSVEVVTHTFWDYPVINGLFGLFFDTSALGKFKFVWARDTKLATRITYNWDPLSKIGIDNSDQYGSHSYTYKIR